MKRAGFHRFCVAAIVAAAQPVLISVDGCMGALSADGTTIVGQAGGRAFRWTSEGGMEDLGVLPGKTHSCAYGVNADGTVIVGESNAAGGYSSRAFRWTPETGMQNLGLIGTGGWARAYGVTPDGSVVVGAGNATPPNFDYAFFWRLGQGMRDLIGTQSGHHRARRISADGSVAVGDDYWHAYRFLGNGVAQDLGTLPGHTSSTATGISADGRVIVGSSSSSLSMSDERAFRWTEEGGMEDLGSLPGATRTSAWEVSADGSVIVGSSGGRAFMWTAETGMVDLNTHLAALGVDLTGWTLVSALGISADHSVIAGNGVFNGQSRVWIVSGLGGTPCPANWNSDGQVNSADISAFLTTWIECVQSGALDADFNQSGEVNSADISAFLTAWLEGVGGC